MHVVTKINRTCTERNQSDITEIRGCLVSAILWVICIIGVVFIIGVLGCVGTITSYSIVLLSMPNHDQQTGCPKNKIPCHAHEKMLCYNEHMQNCVFLAPLMLLFMFLSLVMVYYICACVVMCCVNCCRVREPVVVDTESSTDLEIDFSSDEKIIQ